MKAKFLPLLILFALSVLNADRLNAQIFKKKRHSVTAIMGLANNMTTPFTQSPDPRLKIDYLNGDPIAIPEFYPFAVAATQNALKSILPMSTIGFGARLKHLEAGLNYQVSIGSPVNDFVYENVVFTNNIRFRSLGYYVAYRIEF